MMTKCNLCEDYILKGQKPSCVDSCPMRARDFGPIEEMNTKYGTLAQVFPLPDPKITGPGIIIMPHKDASKANPETAEVTVREEL
jgi:anaerobic dimethyl sulfoxide reductase subunit B (iron-sulfur subunit)